MRTQTVIKNPTQDVQQYGWAKNGGLRLAPGQSFTLDGCVYTSTKAFPGNRVRIAKDIADKRVEITLVAFGVRTVELPYDGAIPDGVVPPMPPPVETPVVKQEADQPKEEKSDLDIFTQPMVNMFPDYDKDGNPLNAEVPLEQPMTSMSEASGFDDSDAIRSELRLCKYNDVKALALAMGFVQTKSSLSKEEAINWIVDNDKTSPRAWALIKDQSVQDMGTVEMIRKAVELAINKA